MLQELRVAEQRYRGCWEVLEGASVTEVARRFGVSRQSVSGGADRRKPAASPDEDTSAELPTGTVSASGQTARKSSFRCSTGRRGQRM